MCIKIKLFNFFARLCLIILDKEACAYPASKAQKPTLPKAQACYYAKSRSRNRQGIKITI